MSKIIKVNKSITLKFEDRIINLPNELKENIEKFKIAQDQYGFAYKVLTKQNHNIGLKQKLRLIILKYFPILHSRIY